jgi:flagellar basal-body rod protein FlgG
MNPAMWISKTGVQAQDAKLQAIANNLANVNTVGFKRDRVVFEDLFYQVDKPARRADARTTTRRRPASSWATAHMVGTQKVLHHRQRAVTNNQSLDVAINGNGFLQVRRPNGEAAYTRAGQLGLDQNGVLVNAQGLPLVPQITVPNNAMSGSLTIGENGTVSVLLPGNTTPTELGQLTVTTFINPAGLQAMGENLFQETAASGAPTEGRPGDAQFGKLRQGALESSNVQVVEEMVDMIAAQRTYEMNTKVLSAADNMLQYLAQAAR